MRATIITFSISAAAVLIVLGGLFNAFSGFGFDTVSPYNDPARVVAIIIGDTPGFALALAGPGYALYDAARAAGSSDCSPGRLPRSLRPASCTLARWLMPSTGSRRSLSFRSLCSCMASWRCPPALQVTQDSATVDCPNGIYPPVTLTNTGAQPLQ